MSRNRVELGFGSHFFARRVVGYWNRLSKDINTLEPFKKGDWTSTSLGKVKLTNIHGVRSNV